MNETLKMLAARRSVAPVAMSGPGPDAAQLDQLLTLAARVPDHGKLAPWRFIVFEGEARARAGAVIAAAFQRDNPDAGADRVDIERTRLSRAPLVVAVVSTAAPHVKIPEWEQLMSAGAVCMNLVIAANAMGFCTAWLTEWFAYDADVRADLGLQGHERFAGLIHIGRSDERPEDRVRPVLADITKRF